MSRGKGHDKRIWPRDRIFGLRRRCPETRVVLLHPSPNTTPIVSGVFFLLWLVGVLGRGLKASMHQNYDREACALTLHWSLESLRRLRLYPTQIEKTVLPLEWHSPSQPLPLFCDTLPIPQREAVKAFYRGIIMDLWPLPSRSHLRICRSAWHTSYLFAHCQSTSMSVVYVGTCPIQFGHVRSISSISPAPAPGSDRLTYLLHTLAYTILV